MAICGLWHGEGWNFIIWGILQGFLLVLHNFYKSFNIRIHKTLAWFITYIVIINSWVVFKCLSMHQAILIIKNMYTGNFSEIKRFQMEIIILTALTLWTKFGPSTRAFVIGITNKKTSNIVLGIMCCICLFYFYQTLQNFYIFSFRHKLWERILL